MIRERVIRFHYDDTALDFITDSQVLDFQIAMGRLMVFGLRSKTNEGIEVIEASMSANGSVVAEYHAPVAWNVDGSTMTQFDALSTAFSAFKSESPVIIQAVPNTAGKYTVF